MPDLHLNVLPRPQAKLWKDLQIFSVPFQSLGFYLAGGTALALQIGHRRSVDFDFFSQKPETTKKVLELLQPFKRLTIRDQNLDTAHIEINGVKVSFIGGYKYPLVEEPKKLTDLDAASIVDIGLMKLLAISHRATMRDYIDLAVIFRDTTPLKTLLTLSSRKYGKNFNPMLSLRALTTFEDLDKEMPNILDRSLRQSWKTLLKEAVQKTLA